VAQQIDHALQNVTPFNTPPPPQGHGVTARVTYQALTDSQLLASADGFPFWCSRS
jgi:hypothetical protein